MEGHSRPVRHQGTGASGKGPEQWPTRARIDLARAGRKPIRRFASHPTLAAPSPSSNRPAWRSRGPAVAGLAARPQETGRRRLAQDTQSILSENGR